MLAVTPQKDQHLALQLQRGYWCNDVSRKVAQCLFHDRKRKREALKKSYLMLCAVQRSSMLEVAWHCLLLPCTKEYNRISTNRSSLSPISFPSNLTFNPTFKFHNPQVKSRSWSRHVINLLTPSPLSMIFGVRGVEFSCHPARKYRGLNAERAVSAFVAVFKRLADFLSDGGDVNRRRDVVARVLAETQVALDDAILQRRVRHFPKFSCINLNFRNSFVDILHKTV